MRVCERAYVQPRSLKKKNPDSGSQARDDIWRGETFTVYLSFGSYGKLKVHNVVVHKFVENFTHFRGR